MTKKNNSTDFRRFIRSPEDPANPIHVVDRSILNLDLLPPFAAEIFREGQRLLNEPLVGITTNGSPIKGLYELERNEVPAKEMTEAAQALVGRIPKHMMERATFPIDDREWRLWTNAFPDWQPQGLLLDDLDNADRDAVLAVVQATLSADGYATARNVMRLNAFLGDLCQDRSTLGEWLYWFSLFGTPSRTEPWGWQLFGHHLALNCFVLGDQIVLTPTFLGAEPYFADEGEFAGTRVFADEERSGLELIRSLSDEQQDKAILYRSIRNEDLPPERKHPADWRQVSGAFQDNRVTPYEGITAGELTREQQQLLIEVVDSYASRLPAGARKAKLKEFEKHLADTHFAWIGGHGDDDPFFYKIQGPTVMIEFDHHPGVFLTNEQPEKFHVHTIVRTPNGNDYGADLLRLHYEKEHKHGHTHGHTHAAKGD